MVCKQCCGLGVRHVQLLLMTFCFAIVQIFHEGPLLAIMLAKTEEHDSSSHHEDQFKNTVVMWGRREIDLLDAGWHYVYPFACFAGGILCNKLNNKHSLLGIVFFLSILCYTLPTIVKRKSESIGFIAMFSVRVIIGIFQGISEPILYQVMGRWVTINDLSFASILCEVGCVTGRVIIHGSMYFIGKNVHGWTSVFYTSGNLGLLWCVAWFTFGAGDFRSCFYVSSDEKNYMINNTYDLDSYGLISEIGKRPFRWKTIFTTMDLYVLLLTNGLTHWSRTHLLVPPFMLEYFNSFHSETPEQFDINKFIGVNIAIILVTVVIGAVADRIVSRGKVRASHVRKTCNSIGFWGKAISMVLTGHASTSVYRRVMSFFLVFFSVFACVGVDVAFLEMAPNYSGFIYAIVTSLTSLPRSALVLANTLTHLTMTPAVFKALLYISALLHFFANFIYVTCFSSRIADFNRSELMIQTKSLSINFSS
ncbi:high affinity inorganic phosphate:sodium symporter activity [Nesidiocoris tenuis]|uniref:High affinity inorganic phosphate:sodium symporter activity n=1 Tax=Nesidiocoris tenuis TaxID=355587 RepID=A0ABN7B0M1_9HEMI|nr:high affinity inorganic phosphate:sodium symporter activity [Nesidiocoris tenuis]